MLSVCFQILAKKIPRGHFKNGNQLYYPFLFLFSLTNTNESTRAMSRGVIADSYMLQRLDLLLWKIQMQTHNNFQTNETTTFTYSFPLYLPFILFTVYFPFEFALKGRTHTDDTGRFVITQWLTNGPNGGLQLFSTSLTVKHQHTRPPHFIFQIGRSLYGTLFTFGGHPRVWCRLTPSVFLGCTRRIEKPVGGGGGVGRVDSCVFRAPERVSAQRKNCPGVQVNREEAEERVASPLRRETLFTGSKTDTTHSP